MVKAKPWSMRCAEVDFAVPRGEFVAIMGPSGSGKSTLLNILGCLDRPTSGTYVLDGEDVSRLEKDKLASVRNRKIGFVFQSFNLLPRLSALENVMVPMLYNGYQHLPVKERRDHAVGLLESVGLGKRVDHIPSKLSGGQQQRVAIARASSTTRRSFWPTSQPATWTAIRVKR